MSDWSNEQIIFFLECYQAEPIIWDPHHKYHKDKKKISDAWERLSGKLNTPSKELKAKKEILMGTFRRHLKKKQESARSGAGADEIYEPIWFAYQLMESFLLPVYTTRNTINTETELSPSQPLEESIEDEKNENDAIETLSTPVISEERQSTSAKKTRRRHAPDPAEQQMATAFSQLTNALSQRQSQPKEDDECDLYAKLLATKLREFSKDERKLLMYEIDGLFINRIRRETPSPQYSFPYLRPSSASTSYSRPPTASTSHSRPQSELNVYIPNRPSTALSSCSEPITNVCASNGPKTDQTSFSEPDLPSTADASYSRAILKKIVYLKKPASVQSSVPSPSVPLSDVHTSSVQSSNTYSTSSSSAVQSSNTFSVPCPTSVQFLQPSSGQPANAYLIQLQHVQSSNTYTVPSPSVPLSDIHSVQTSYVQSSNTYSTSSSSAVQSSNTYSVPYTSDPFLQPPSGQSAINYSILPSSVQSSNDHTYYNSEIPSITLPSETETIPRSNIINMALLKSFERFESDETNEP